METLGAFLRTLRERSGKTLEEVGQALSPPVQRAAVHKWESNINPLRVGTLRQLLDIYGADTEQRVQALELAVHDPSQGPDDHPDPSGPSQAVTADAHTELSDDPTEETTAPPTSGVEA